MSIYASDRRKLKSVRRQAHRSNEIIERRIINSRRLSKLPCAIGRSPANSRNAIVLYIHPITSIYREGLKNLGIFGVIKETGGGSYIMAYYGRLPKEADAEGRYAKSTERRAVMRINHAVMCRRGGILGFPANARPTDQPYQKLSGEIFCQYDRMTIDGIRGADWR